MIVAYPLDDIVSVNKKDKKRIIYQHAGIATLVVVVMDNMMILENKKGDRFPVNKNRVVWCEY